MDILGHSKHVPIVGKGIADRLGNILVLLISLHKIVEGIHPALGDVVGKGRGVVKHDIRKGACLGLGHHVFRAMARQIVLIDGQLNIGIKLTDGVKQGRIIRGAGRVDAYRDRAGHLIIRILVVPAADIQSRSAGNLLLISGRVTAGVAWGRFLLLFAACCQ